MAEINIRITGKDEASAAIKTVKTSADSLGTSVTGMSSSFTAAATSAAAVAVGMAGLAVLDTVRQMAVATASAFVEINAANERYVATLVTLTGSQEEANATFEQLNDFAQKTPYQIDALMDAYIRLSANGLTPTIEMMRTLGDTTAALGGSEATFDGISRALGQMYTKGEASAQELRQLAEWGVPAYEILAEKLNLTGAEVQNIGKMGVSAGEAIEALMEGMDERFSGQMERMQSTWAGGVEEIESLWRNVLTAIGDAGAFDSLKDEMFEMRDALQQALDDGTVERWAKSIVLGIDTLIALKDAVVAIATPLFYIEDVFMGWRAALHDFREELSSIDEFDNLVGAGAAEFEALTEAIDGTSSSTANLVEKLGEVRFGIAAIKEEVQADEGPMFVFDAEAAIEQLSALSEAISDIGDVSIEFAGDALAESLEEAGVGIEAMQAALAAYEGAVNETYSVQIALQGQAIEGIEGIVSAVGTSKEATKALTSATKEYYSSIEGQLQAGLKGWESYYDGLSTAHAETIEEIAKREKALADLEKQYASDVEDMTAIEASLRMAAYPEIENTAESYYARQHELDLQLGAALSLSGQARIDALKAWAQASTDAAKAIIETDGSVIKSADAVLVAHQALQTAQIEIAKTHEEMATQAQADIVSQQALAEELKSEMVRAEDQIGSYKLKLEDLDKLIRMERVLAISTEDSIMQVKDLANSITALSSEVLLNLSAETAEGEAKKVLEVITAMSTTQKLAIDNAAALTAAQEVKASIDAIPDVTYKSVIVQYFTQASPVREFTEGMEHIQERMESLPTEGTYTVRATLPDADPVGPASGQIGTTINTISQRTSSASSVSFAPTINITATGGQSGQALAAEIDRQLADMWRYNRSELRRAVAR